MSFRGPRLGGCSRDTRLDEPLTIREFVQPIGALTFHAVSFPYFLKAIALEPICLELLDRKTARDSTGTRVVRPINR